MAGGTFSDALELQRAKRHAEAKAIYRRLYDEGRRDQPLLHNLGIACLRTYDPEAETFLRQAAALEEGGPSGPRARGYLALAAGRFAEAEALFLQALPGLPADDTAHEGLALARLGQGQWSRGFQGLLHRPERLRSTGRRLGIPEWQGEPLEGKRLLILSEQGLGDQIQFARFIPLLGAGKVTYVGPPVLARLFASLPLDYLAAGTDGSFRAPVHDYWTQPLSLPGRLGLAEVPASPYLPGAPGGRGIGFLWRGNPKNPVDGVRSIPDSLAAEILSLPGVTSLRPEDTGARDFQDTAELIKGLERVVTVDTSVAHLAGAMGKPVSVLLPSFGLDWRWMAERCDSAWYPSARLYRQAAPGDWRPVLRAVKRDLAA